jgi:hypothetical protein
MDLLTYLETRIEALDILIELHRAQTGDYLVMERAVCLIQLDKLKLKARENLSES